MYLVFSLLCIIYILLHLVPVGIPSPFFWGVDAWSYFPRPVGVILAFTGACMFLPAVRRSVRKPLSTVGGFLSQIPLPVVIALAGIIMYLFSQRTFFLGDGRLRMLSTELGVLFAVEEPFDTLLHGIIFQTLNPPTGLSGRGTYRLISILAGMSALGGGTYYLRRLYPGRSERWTAGVLLATCGTVQLFFGYAESYSVAAVLILVYLLATIEMLRNRKYSIAPAILLSLAAAFHPLSVMLAPGAAYGYFNVIQDAGATRRKKVTYWIFPAAIVLGTAAIVILMFHLGGTPAGEFFTHYLKGGNLLPLFRKGDLYGILSPDHLLDMANELWLTVPTLAALALMAGKAGKAFIRQRTTVFLMLSSAGLLVFMALFHPRLGFARDWDLFAAAAFPLTLLATEAVISLTPNERFRFALPLVMISLVHTAPWVGVNASETLSTQRFDIISNNPYWSIHARELAFNNLALYHQSNDRNDEYFRYAEKTFRLRKNRKYFGYLASTYYKHGMFGELSALAALDETNPEGWFFLGILHQDRDEYDSALALFDRVLSLDPAFPGIHLKRGQLFIDMGRIENATSELEQGLAQSDMLVDDPVFSRTSVGLHIMENNLGLCYLKTGRAADAIIWFSAALESHPDYHQAHYNIAVAYLQVGNTEDAARHAKLARQYGHEKSEVEALERVIGMK